MTALFNRHTHAVSHTWMATMRVVSHCNQSLTLKLVD